VLDGGAVILRPGQSLKDLNLLYVFEALWRDRSVTLASDQLGVTQAAVSGSLKRLREHYGDKLFTLVGRRMEPTPRATELAPQLLDALTLVRRADGEPSRFDPAKARRTFTVRTRDIGEVVCLPGMTTSMGSAAPHVQLRTVLHPRAETLAGLATGRIDLALGFLPSLEADIHRRILFNETYVCVMRRGHPLARAGLTPESFLAAEHVLVEYSGSGHTALEKLITESGGRKRIRVRLPQYLAAPHFLLQSDLLWSAPRVLAQQMAVHLPLEIAPHPMPLPSFEVALYWHDRYHRDAANIWFRDFLAEHVEQRIRKSV
jgi:DNA-binding transcriptional LysR family regulator